MAQQLTILQCSLYSYSVSIQNLSKQSQLEVVRTLKQSQATWNCLSNTFDLPIEKYYPFSQALQKLKPKIGLKEPPNHLIKSFLQQQDKKKKGNRKDRILVVDPLMMKRFPFVQKFIEDNNKNEYRRVLILCSRGAKRQWQEMLGRISNSHCKEVDYESLQSRSHDSKLAILNGNLFEFLPFDQLQEKASFLTSPVLVKYTTIICDDAQIWLNPTQSIHLNSQNAENIKRVLMNADFDKEMLLIVSKLSWNLEQIMLIGSVLRPKQFGTDPLSIAKGDSKDISWFKTRYKDKRYQKQLFFLVLNTILQNLQERKGLLQFTEMRYGLCFATHLITLPLGQELRKKLKDLEKKYRTVDAKRLLSSLQNPREETIKMNALKEDEYLRELRDLINSDKEVKMLSWLMHMTLVLRQKVVVIVQTQVKQQKFQNFFKDSGIKYVLYSLKKDSELLDPQIQLPTTFRPSGNSEYMICLIVRQKLIRQIRQLEMEREKMLSLREQQYLENEIGIQEGGLFAIVQSIFTITSGSTTYSQKPSLLFDLPKISHISHILFVDSFLQEFSQKSERAILNIFTIPLGKVKTQKQSEESHNVVRHFFIFDEKLDEPILKRYLQNVKQLYSRVKQRRKQVEVKDFWINTLERCKTLTEGRQIVTSLYDIDQQFDRIEYDAQKERQEFQKDDKPSWNTKIEGLVVEATLPKEQYQNQSKSPYIQMRPSEAIEESSWESTSSQEKSSQEKDISKYLVLKDTSKKYHSEKILQKDEKKSMLNQQVFSLPFLSMRLENKDLRVEQNNSKQKVNRTFKVNPSKKVSQEIKSKYLSASIKRGKRKIWPKQKVIARKFPTIRIKLVEFSSNITFKVNPQ